MLPLIRRINRKWFYGLLYLGRPPWDTRITPPEVVTFAEGWQQGSSRLTKPKALDLGCGPGVSSIYLAGMGWDVIGVDFIPLAIREARRRARQAGLSREQMPEFRVGDVTSLNHLRHPSGQPYDLVLDIGCFHSLPLAGQERYVENLDSLLVPGGSFLMYGFLQSAPGGLGVSEALIERLNRKYSPVFRQDGEDSGRASAWFHYRREAG